MGQTFDWQTFMDTHSPSHLPTSSQVQKDRQILLDSLLLPDLHAWVGQQKLQVCWRGNMAGFSKYLQVAALATALQTLNTHEYCCHTTCRTRYAFWFATLDQYVDHYLLSFLLRQDWDIDQKMAYLDSRLAFICEPFVTLGNLTSQQVQESRLSCDIMTEKTFPVSDVLHPTDHIKDTLSNDNVALLLKNAWTDIYDNLKVHLLTCRGKEEHVHSATDRAEYSAFHASEQDVNPHFFLSKFVHETAIGIGALRDEIIYTLRFHLKQEKLDFEDVLARSTHTVIFAAFIALALLLDPATACSEDWERWLPIAKQGAKVFRLANDCADVPRDLAERQMTCVTVLLSSFEGAATSSSPGDSQEVQTAIDLVRQRRVKELFHYNDLINNIIDNKCSFTTLDENILHIISSMVAYTY
jgi:hypothetical protein